MIKVMTRAQWRASAATGQMATNPPPREAFIHYTENPTKGRVLTVEQQIAAMQSIQQFHQRTRGWSDIAYHYLVFQGGEHRGARPWQGRLVSEVPAAQLGHNTGTLAIAVYAGPGDALRPNTRYVIEQLIRRHPTVALVGGHRQVVSTDCPGDLIAAAVPTIARACGLGVFANGRGL